MASTLLIVEDEPDISLLLRTHFKKEGYDVAAARTAENGLKLARKQEPAVVLLDITLPGMDGLEMLSELRRITAAPVLFLSAKRDEVVRILGLKLGADDYVTKPFSLAELSLRVKRLLRREAPVVTDRPIRVGGAEISLDRHDVRMNGRAVSLTPLEFQLLKALVEAKGRVLTREQLAADLWRGDSEEMDLRGVDQHVARLRKKLAPDHRLISTVSKIGYQIKTSEPAPARSTRRAS